MISGLRARPPVGLQQLCDELVAHVRSAPDGAAPNAWRIEVPRRDLRARADESGGWPDALRDAVVETARDRGKAVAGVVTVDLVPVDHLRRGQARVTGSVAPGRPDLVPVDDAPRVPGSPRLVLPAGGDAPHGSWEGAGLQRELLLPAGRLVVGTSPDAHVHLEGVGLVGRHAELHVAADGTAVSVRDLGSSAGTRVDGVPRAEHPLTDGSRLQLGEAVAVLRIDPLPHPGRQGGGPEPEAVDGEEDGGATSGTPVGPDTVAGGVHRTPNALWVAVVLMVAGAVLVGLAVALLDLGGTPSLACLVAGVVLGLAGVVQAYRRRIFDAVE